MDSSSDLTLSSDWDIINCSTGENKNDVEEHTDEILAKDEMADVAEKVKEPKGTGVHDIPELECTNQNESSSSEFDVIDETADENHSNVSISNMEFSLSSSLGSRPPVVPEPEPQFEHGQPVNHRLSIFDGFHLYPNLVQRVIIIIAMLVVIIGIYFSASDSAQGAINHMKDRMSALQAENIELKSQMRSKFENNNMLMALEEQIKALKDENFKLSSSMQALVLQLEEQTAILKKEKETKEQDPYRSEIENLKGHISKLQSDGKVFQDQIEGIRIGLLSPVHVMAMQYVESPPEEENGKLKENLDQNENHENSSEKVAEKLQELKKMMDGELDRLLKWKESVLQRVEEVDHGSYESLTEDELQYSESKYRHPNREEIGIIEEKEKKHSDGEWELSKEEMELSQREWQLKDKKPPKREQVLSEREWKLKKDEKPLKREQELSQGEWKPKKNMKPSRWEDKPSKKYKKPYEREQEFSKKEKKPPIIEKESEWSWNILKKNLKGTIDGLPKINVPDMLSNYVDKKRVENVFESVGHYFKKAQEKTKKILNYNKESKDYFWNFLGDLRKKWSDIKDEFFENTYRNSEDSKSEFSTDIPSQSQEGFMASKKFKKSKVFETHEKLSEDDTTSPEAQDWDRSIKKPKEQNEDIDDMAQSNKDTVINWFLKRNKNEDIDAMTEEDKKAVINWFLRRNKDEEEIEAMTEADKDAVINWFLKRNKDKYIDTELHEWLAYWNNFNNPSDEE